MSGAAGRGAAGRGAAAHGGDLRRSTLQRAFGTSATAEARAVLKLELRFES